MNAIRRRHTLVGFSTAITAGLLAITGCSNGERANGAAPAASQEIIADTEASASSEAPEVTPAAAETKIRTLPVEDYLPSSAEYVKITKARVRLDEQCMRGFGFTGFEALSVPQQDPRDSFTADRYGIEDAAQAAQFGYHPAPALKAFAQGAPEPDLSADEELVMTGLPAGQSDTADLKAAAAPRSFKGKTVPEGGCIGQSTRQLTGGSDELYPDLPQDINGQSYRKAKEAPRVREAFAAWSQCMKSKGFTYSDPMQANDDPKFSNSGTATGAEIATATSDVACKNSSRLVDIWFQAEVDIQKSLIEGHRTELTPMKNTKQNALAKASAVLAK